MSQKRLNDEERGGNCLLVPERSYGPEDFHFVLEVPRDQDPGLEDYVTVESCTKLNSQINVLLSHVFDDSRDRVAESRL